MIFLNYTFRFVTIALLLMRIMYWYVTAKIAEEKMPSVKKKVTPIFFVQRFADIFFVAFLIIQLVGVNILPMRFFPDIVQTCGFAIVLIGFLFAIAGRMTIGENWSHAANYQIKEHQELVTTGVYSLVRHPIYLGFTLLYIGAEMVAQSYLFISLFALFYHFYVQAKKEEMLLLAHFGKEYAQYMKKTAMMIPFVL